MWCYVVLCCVMYCIFCFICVCTGSVTPASAAGAVDAACPHFFSATTHPTPPTLLTVCRLPRRRLPHAGSRSPIPRSQTHVSPSYAAPMSEHQTSSMHHVAAFSLRKRCFVGLTAVRNHDPSFFLAAARPLGRPREVLCHCTKRFPKQCSASLPAASRSLAKVNNLLWFAPTELGLQRMVNQHP